MRRGFVDYDLLVPFFIVTFSLVLCLPVLQLMRSSRLSPVMGVTIIAGVCSFLLAPWVYLDIASRRELRKLRDQDEEQRVPEQASTRSRSSGPGGTASALPADGGSTTPAEKADQTEPSNGDTGH